VSLFLYNPYLGGWVPWHDENMETSSPGVFVAGDGTGIEGSLVALAEGRLAAIRASRDLGYITHEDARSRSMPILRELKGLRRFESALNNVSLIRDGLFSLISDDTVICRCKEVSAGEIQQSISNGARSMGEIKRFTMSGMGHCQGRICENTIAEMLTKSTNAQIEHVGYFTPRPPVKPLSIDIFQSYGEDGEVKGFVH